MNKVLVDAVISVLVPHMEDQEERRILVQTALFDSPILDKIDWEGAPYSFTSNLVLRLIRYEGKTSRLLSIIALLTEVKKYVGTDQHSSIDDLIEAIGRRNTPTPQPVENNYTEPRAPIQVTRPPRSWTNVIVVGGVLIVFFAMMIALFPLLSAQLAPQDISGTQTQMALAITPSKEPIQPTKTPDQPTNTPVMPTQKPPTKTPVPPTQTLAPTSTSTPTPLPKFNPVGQNRNWKPIEERFSGITMVLVPPGCFPMGDKIIRNAMPEHEQCFETAFWIDKYEVTNGMFENLGGIASSKGTWSDLTQPREMVTWFEAYNFCHLRQEGVRLPTEREWEYAASGPDGWSYPWSDTWNKNNAFWQGNSDSQTESELRLRDGESWVGALHMSGNVQEWTNSQFMDYPYAINDGREAFTSETTVSSGEVLGIPPMIMGLFVLIIALVMDLHTKAIR